RCLQEESELEVGASSDGILRAANERQGITLMQAAYRAGSPDYAFRMERFGEIVAEELLGNRYASALLCGGQTAQTVMKYVGATHAQLLGSAAAGIPLLSVRVGDKYLTLLTKSGGFGPPDALAALFYSDNAGTIQ